MSDKQINFDDLKKTILEFYESRRVDIWLIFLLLTFTFVISKYGWSIITGDFGTYTPISDMGQFYLQSFGSPNVVAPWKYRILTPFLVSLLPFNHLFGFYILNLFFAFITVIIYYYFFKELGFSPQTSALGGTMFIVSEVVLYNFFLPMADPLTHLLIISTFYLTKKGYYYAIPIIVCIGVLNHESIAFLILLYIPFEKNNIKRVIIFSLPFLEELLIRLLLGYVSVFTDMVILYMIHHPFTEILFIGQTYLFIWLGVKNIFKIPFIKKSSLVILGIIPFLFLALHTERMLFLVAPIIIASFLYEIERPKLGDTEIKGNIESGSISSKEQSPSST